MLSNNYLSLDRIALAVYHGVRCHDTVRRRICLHDLELDRSHATAHDKYVPLVDGAVRLEEVRLEVDFKQVPASNGKDHLMKGLPTVTWADIGGQGPVHEAT